VSSNGLNWVIWPQGVRSYESAILALGFNYGMVGLFDR